MTEPSAEPVDGVTDVGDELEAGDAGDGGVADVENPVVPSISAHAVRLAASNDQMAGWVEETGATIGTKARRGETCAAAVR